MGFTKQDKYFFSIILKHGKIFDDVVQKSYGYNIDLENALKKDEGKISVINKNTGENNYHSFILYGKYNENTETFIWFNNIQNIILQDMIKKDIIGVFSTSYYRGPTIVKLLSKPKIKISKKYKKVIPYLLAIIQNTYNIISFDTSNKNETVYVGIAMNIKDKFNQKLFDKDMEKYNNMGNNVTGNNLMGNNLMGNNLMGNNLMGKKKITARIRKHPRKHKTIRRILRKSKRIY
jgi:hypothetical protein